MDANIYTVVDALAKEQAKQADLVTLLCMYAGTKGKRKKRIRKKIRKIVKKSRM